MLAKMVGWCETSKYYQNCLKFYHTCFLAYLSHPTKGRAKIQKRGIKCHPERERERERDRQTDREREREAETETETEIDG